MNASFQVRPSRRQFIATTVAVGTAGIGGSVFARPAPGRQLTIRFNHTDGPGGDGYHFSERLRGLLAERSAGRIQVQNFHAGQLGAERDMFDSMQIGAIEMGRSGSMIISVAAPQYAALDMPYVFRSQQHLRNVLAGPIGQTMHQEFLVRRGVRVLGIVNRGPRHLTTRNRAVNMKLVANVRHGLRQLIETAPQLTKPQRWVALVRYIVQQIFERVPKHNLGLAALASW